MVLMGVCLPQGVLAADSKQNVPASPAGKPVPVQYEENAEAKFCVEPIKVVRTVKMIATAYTASPDETDDTPHITAAGTRTREGIVANNMLKFGTKVRINGKVYTVEDRMHSRKGKYMIDILMASKEEAFEWGARKVTVEILES